MKAPLEPKYFSRNTISDNNLSPLQAGCDIIVVIPAYKEDNLLVTLNSLLNCTPSQSSVEVIVVNNLPQGSFENTIAIQKQLNTQILNLNCGNNAFIRFVPLEEFNLPVDNFGAGLARKIGMDIAAKRLFNAGNENGIIVSLDADCLVETNYFVEIEHYFKNKNRKGASIYFEHPLHGLLPAINYQAITQYELHLRYYNLMLLHIGFPHAFQTVGSSFAVRAETYVKAGGMTKKIAGEDFYFIQKVLSLGGFGNMLKTTVYPSARLSSRVLFGTGAAVTKFVQEEATSYFTFRVEPFLHLQLFFEAKDKFYNTPFQDWHTFLEPFDPSLLSFLSFANTLIQLEKLKQNCATLATFQKRFFAIIDGLLIVRYLNYVHEKYVSKVEVSRAVNEYLKLINHPLKSTLDIDQLFLLRQLEREFAI